MNRNIRCLSHGVALIAVGLLTACTTDSLIPDRRPDYRQSRVQTPLELPPDLTTSTRDESLRVPDLDPGGTATLSAYDQERGPDGRAVAIDEPVLASPEGMTIRRDGERRWLVIQSEPDRLWEKFKDFWTNAGFELKRADPRLGIMETQWAENRADIPKSLIRSLLSKAIEFAYAAPTRDKFRMRLERVETGTEVYITHYGVEEVVRGEGRQSTDVLWQPRPSDPELEAEMLRRMMVYLGASEQQAEVQVAKAETPREVRARRLDLSEGVNALLVAEPYPRAWRLIGLALDGTGFVVEDQNRSQGLYVVEYNDPRDEISEQGWLSQLAFWKDNKPKQGSRYHLRVGDRGDQSLVMVYSAQGQPDTSATAQRLLDTLLATLK